MSEYIDFFVPMKIVSEANNREHWWAKSKRKNSINKALDLFLNPIDSYPMPCIITFTRAGVRFLDDDNLAYAFKGVRDHVAYRIISKIDNLVPKLTLVDGKRKKEDIGRHEGIGKHDQDKRLNFAYSQIKGEYGFQVTIEKRSQ